MSFDAGALGFTAASPIFKRTAPSLWHPNPVPQHRSLESKSLTEERYSSKTASHSVRSDLLCSLTTSKTLVTPSGVASRQSRAQVAPKLKVNGDTVGYSQRLLHTGHPLRDSQDRRSWIEPTNAIVAISNTY